MTQANAPSAQWTESAASGIAARLTRAFLVRRGPLYVLDSDGPAEATLQEDAGGTLRVDDNLDNGKRLAVNATGTVFIY